MGCTTSKNKYFINAKYIQPDIKMASFLIGLHAALGEIGLAAFIWVFVELLKPSSERVRRAKIAAVIGTILFFISWIIGGYYYLTIYGSVVKPLIKGGSQPWGHLVAMEAKEHIFLFLPILSLVSLAILKKEEKTLSQNKNPSTKKALLILVALIIILGVAMGLLGYLISSSARAALEAKI